MPLYPRPFSIPEKDLPRLWSKVPPADGDACRDWRGAPYGSSGYGQFSFAPEDGSKRWQVQAHNAVWVATHGLFLPELQPDHLCFRGICVNTNHIEWITAEENNRRRRYLNTGCCASGRHRWDEQVPLMSPSGERECRLCRNERRRASRPARAKV